ncbi:hypothetical protein TeGR_g9923, partial [Tetraparma gracilis]
TLAREYASFFSPPEPSCYNPAVSFEDPLTSFSGLGKYQANVDMLASRTPLGKFLFADAVILLHSTTPLPPPHALQTRWTLKMRMPAFPWKPALAFTGVSRYSLDDGGRVLAQEDYWDSIDATPGGGYARSGRGGALGDFLGQIFDPGVKAVAAAPELPYTLLRRGPGYEVRRLPRAVAYAGLEYGRRDEVFERLGRATRGVEGVMGPATIEVGGGKRMWWPVAFSMGDTRELEEVAER